MAILIDLSYIRDKNLFAGVSKYAYRYLDYIIENHEEEKYILLCNVLSVDFIRLKYSRFKIYAIGIKWLRKIPVLRTLSATFCFWYKVNHINVDLVFCPFGSEINCVKINKLKISTVHDLQLQLDLRGLGRYIKKYIDDKVMSTSDEILTISDFSKAQIMKIYPSYTKEIVNLGNTVSMLPLNDNFIPPLNDQYILYVGRLSEKKNVITLLKAFNIVKSAGYPHKLVLITTEWRYWDEVMHPYIVNHGLENDVILKLNVDENQLSLWYSNAKLFVFPSVREGFGFPPIEAALMKIPVITTLSDSLGEVTKGLLFSYKDPYNEEELSKLIIKVLETPPTEVELEKIKNIYIDSYSIYTFGNKLSAYLLSKMR